MVIINRKQQTITKLFRKQGPGQTPEDCEELEEEIKQLEQELKAKQDELFQVQRNSYKRKVAPVKSRNEQFLRPEQIILKNNKAHLEQKLEMLTMLSGIEVKTYTDEHCVIIYHMQHSPHNIQHGLKINMKSGNNIVSNYSMPLGFNFNAVVEEFDNIKTPDCLVAIRSALVAYYDRQEQYDALKNLLSIDAQLFKVMDTTHIEITFKVCLCDDEAIDITLTLDYRVYDIRPKLYFVKGSDLDQPTIDLLTAQCSIFKKEPLPRAFRECFMADSAAYSIVRQLNPGETISRSRQRRRRPRPNDNHDDTFRPEDCSEHSEEDDDRQLRQVYYR